MRRKLKRWVAVIGLMAFCLLAIGGAAGADVRELSPQATAGARLEAQKENSTSKPNDAGNSAVVDGRFLSKERAWTKDHGVGLLYGLGVGIVVGVAVAGVAVLLVASAPFWAIVAAGALAGGVYGLISGAIKFDIWDCALFSVIGAVSAGVGSGLPGAGLAGWMGRGAVEGVGGGLISLGSYLLHNPHPTWGGAGQAFGMGAATAIAFMGLGAGVNKLLGGRVAALGAKLRSLLRVGRGSASALEAETAAAAEAAALERPGLGQANQAGVGHRLASAATPTSESGASQGLLSEQGSSTVAARAGDGRAPRVSQYDVVPYRPTNAGIENHHGVLDVWAKHNVPGYVSRGADTPTVALSPANHEATKRVFRDWLFDRTGKRVGAQVDWTQVTAAEVQELSDRMFEAADVPPDARQAYYRELYQYIYR